MAKVAPQRTTAKKVVKNITAEPISLVTADESLSHSSARTVRLDIQRSLGTGVFGLPTEKATMEQLFAIAFSPFSDDPITGGLQAMAEELEALSVATEADSGAYRVELGTILARLSRRAEAFAEMHHRMMRSAMDHVESLAAEKEADA